MKDPERDHWNQARSEVVARWRKIIERIEARDEGGALSLANEMDEFCDEAITARHSADQTTTGAPAATATDGPAGGGAVTRCNFCRGFTNLGGCFGLIRDVNHAVLSGDWESAQRIAETNIANLESVDLLPR